MITPWGKSDGQQTLAEGIVSYTTPSHGGIWLSKERQEHIPAGIKNFLGDRTWWEEDCDWVVPYLIFQEDIRKHGTAYAFEKNLESAKIIAAHYHKDLLAHLV